METQDRHEAVSKPGDPRLRGMIPGDEQIRGPGIDVEHVVVYELRVI